LISFFFQKIEVKIWHKDKDILPSYYSTQTVQTTLNLQTIMSAHSRKISSSSAAKAVRKAACNSDPAEGISLCIPRVFNNIGWRRIKQCFIDLRWGFVERVDVISLGKNKRAFVHFAPGKWNTRDQEAMQALQALQNGDEVKVLMQALQALQNGDEVKVLYDDPWYWKISISNSAKPDEAPKPRARPSTTIGRKETLDLSTSTESKGPSVQTSPGNDPIAARIASSSPQKTSNGPQAISYEDVGQLDD